MNNIDQVYIINLEEEAKRKEHMTQLINQMGVAEVSNFFPAVNGASINEKYLNEASLQIYPWDIRFYENDLEKYAYFKSFYFRNMNKGEIGCALSHIGIWEDILRKKRNRTIVLEDDICITDNLSPKEIMKEIQSVTHALDTYDKSWDMCYLGKFPLIKDIVINEKIAIPNYSWQSHAYILNYSGARKLLEANPKQNLIPIDEFLPTMYGKHIRKDLLDKFANTTKLNTYTVTNDIFYQNRKMFKSAISG